MCMSEVALVIIEESDINMLLLMISSHKYLSKSEKY